MEGRRFTRPVWAEISRSRLIANYHALRALAPASAVLLAVVKANAYGHGVDLCAPALAAAGADWLGVTSVEEGVRVRALCQQPHILIMSGIHRDEAAPVLDCRLTPVVWESYHLDLLETEAAHRGMPPQSVPVHLELDTGMARQGVPVAAERVDPLTDLAAILVRFHADSPLRLEAVMTHFHSPEVLTAANPPTKAQMGKLAAALALIRGRGLQPLLLHAGNSATLLEGPDGAELDRMAHAGNMRLMLRPGLALYGCAPAFTPPQGRLPRLQPVLAWKTRINSLRTLQPGDTAGYNATFRASRPTRLALLPIGYADGYNRLLSNRGHVLIRGQRAAVAGRVSMDQIIVDVTDIPTAAIADEAVLLGAQDADAITAEDLAALTGTIPYEVLCNINARVPRFLVD
ncbi:MAG: alanine racemase [Acidobacteriaceae bacterium]